MAGLQELQDAGAGRSRDAAEHAACVCAQGDVQPLRPAACAAHCTGKHGVAELVYAVVYNSRRGWPENDAREVFRYSRHDFTRA